nr:MAG TPA: antitoxin [Inoviridae sp.]
MTATPISVPDRCRANAVCLACECPERDRQTALARHERSAKLTIDDIYAEKYGITPEGYYRQQLREGVAAAAALRDLNQKVDDIWKCEKNGGFYPVDETDLPEGFI